jgi:uncharacterized protein (DUF58 family)
LRQILIALEKAPEGHGTDLTAPLRRIAELVRRKSLMILVSDLLAPLEEVEKHLSRLAASGHELVVFQVLDPAEVHFAYEEAALFRDVESGKDLYVDPPAAKDAYQKALKAHLDAIKKICQKLGAGYYRFSTDDPLDKTLRNFVQDRRQLGKIVRRR